MRRGATFCAFCFGIFLISFPFIINAASVTHKVRSGDNLYDLARKYKVTVNQLKNINGLRSNKLSIGQMIIIKDENTRVAKRNPGKKLSTKKIRIQKRSYAVVEPDDILEDEDEFIEYKIKTGDTVDSIASRFNVPKDEFIETNNIASDNSKKLSPGKTVLIPKMIEEKDEEEIVTFKSSPLKPWKNSDEKYMLVKVAKSFVGAPYKYGGTTLRGLDCSAYVKKIYEIFDVQLPRSAREQYKVGSKIDRSQLAIGDLVFFKTRRYAKYPTHVGIFIGDSNFIHASSGKRKLGVKIDSLNSNYYSRAFVGATRIKGLSDGESPEATQPVEKSSDNS